MIEVLMSLPYAFLAMGCDVLWDMFLPYPAVILCAAMLSRMAKKRGKPHRWVIFSGISLILSTVLSACVAAERWQWYFKPFSAEGMAVMISLVMIGMQWIVRKKIH